MTDGRDALTDLIARMNAGDREAGNRLFERVYPRQVQLTRLMLGTFPDIDRGHDPESLVHLGWINLMTALRTQQPETPRLYLGLMARKVRFALLDLAQNERGRIDRAPLTRGSGDPDASAANYEPSAGSSCDPGRLELWTRFHEAVSELPDDLREAFELYFYTDEKSNGADVARTLGLSFSKATRLIAKARDLLVQRVGGLDELLS